MTWKMERSVQPGLTIFVLSGRLADEEIAELERVFGPRSDYRSVIVDLKDLRLVNRAAVKFLARCEADGLRFENCPAYIRKWIRAERAE
jgi:hypothetical protein